MPHRFPEPILHVDMDAFFVEVERRRDPSLVGRPVLVGGTGPRAVVASASYEARSRGVGSAMPMVEARRRCPDAVVVPPDHRAYGDASREVFAVLQSFTPLVEGLSVDEAFLDVGGLRLHYADAAGVGAEIRQQIRTLVGLPASVGIAVNKLIAKLASEEAKPDGLVVVAAGDELAFLHSLPVHRLWGVGQATLAGLEVLGVSTVGDLAAVPLATLQRRLGLSLGTHLAELAMARDDRPVTTEGETKSVSVEETYDADLTDRDDMERALLTLCDRLGARLNAAGIAGRTLTLKLRFEDFTTVTRSMSMSDAIDHTPDLWDGAKSLIGKIEVEGRGVRLLGVGVSSLVAADSPRQLSMGHPGRDAAAAAAERVRERFGADAVVPARVVGRAGGRLKRRDPPKQP